MTVLARLFSFEGIEGCGKSTAIQEVAQKLRDQGHRVEVFREPGSSRLGESVRQLLLDQNLPKTAWSEFYLFLAARQELMTTQVLPLLQSDPKALVLLDRYHDSSLAYQGEGRGLGIDALLSTIEAGPLNVWPTKRFYLSISWEISLQRRAHRAQQKDYFEREEADFFKRVQKGYETLAGRFAKNFATIDASQDLPQVVSDIVNHIKVSLESQAK